MELVRQDGLCWYVNPKFPDSALSPEFDNEAYALQWRGRVGQENFGDIEELTAQVAKLQERDIQRTLELKNIVTGLDALIADRDSFATKVMELELDIKRRRESFQEMMITYGMVADNLTFYRNKCETLAAELAESRALNAKYKERYENK